VSRKAFHSIVKGLSRTLNKAVDYDANDIFLATPGVYKHTLIAIDAQIKKLEDQEVETEFTILVGGMMESLKSKLKRNSVVRQWLTIVI
jgi:hypothetical protein